MSFEDESMNRLAEICSVKSRVLAKHPSPALDHLPLFGVMIPIQSQGSGGSRGYSSSILESRSQGTLHTNMLNII